MTMSSWNAVALLALLSTAAAAEEAALSSPPAPPPEPEAKNLIWIEPLAGGPGRASISYERALGKGASLHFGLLGGFDVGTISDLASGSRFAFDGGVGLAGLGVRAFPLGQAPFGPWLGASARAGVGGQSLEVTDGADQSMFAHQELVFIGEGELQAGYSLLAWKGLSLQGSLGFRVRYLRYLDGLAGEALQLGLTTWLGVGYAF